MSELKKLVEKWRERTVRVNDGFIYMREFSSGIKWCADELESALAAQPQVSEEQVRTLVPLDGGNWYYDHHLLSAPATPAPKLAKFQPCGCVLCSCEDLYQCQGCGSKLCDAHKYDKVERRYVTEPAPAAPAPTELRPTYYVKHPDNTYSEADPQPYFDYEAMANNTFANGVPCYRLKRKEENNERRRRW